MEIPRPRQARRPGRQSRPTRHAYRTRARCARLAIAPGHPRVSPRRPKRPGQACVRHQPPYGAQRGRLRTQAMGRRATTSISADIPEWATLLDCLIIGAQLFQPEDCQLRSELLFGVQLRRGARAAGAVRELFDPIALEQQKPTWSQRLCDPVEHPPPQIGRGELDEDRGDDVVGALRPAPGISIRDREPHRHAPLRGEPSGFLDGHRRGVEGVHVEPLARQPDAVPAFAVGDTESATAIAEEAPACDEEPVRLGTEQILVAGVAVVPRRRPGPSGRVARLHARERSRGYRTGAGSAPGA